MNRGDIRALVVEATKRTDKVSLINSAIDMAVEEISAQRNWSDLQTEADSVILSGTPSVALASDVAKIIEIRKIDGFLSRSLIIRPKSWLMKHFPYISFQLPSRPVYGYLEGKTLFLLPIPNKDYTIRYTYYRLHPRLAGDSSEVLIRHAGPAVAAYASWWTFQSVEKVQEAQMWLQTYSGLLASAKKVDADNTVVQSRNDIRGREPHGVVDYWLDPFTKSMP